MTDSPGRDRNPSTLTLIALVLAIAATASQAGTLLSKHLGSTAGERLGAVACAGDVDGDGVGDLVLGSPWDDRYGVDAGSVRIVSGADGSTLYELEGPAAGAEFGFAVAAAGDLDGDGFADVAVGTPATGLAGTSGSVQVYSGADGSVLLQLEGGNAGDGFGFAVRGASDLDGDGSPDLVVGAPFASTGGGLHSGAVHAFSGSTGLELFRIDGDDAGDELGRSLDSMSTVGFADADSDVIIGATAGGSEDQGAARVIEPATQTVKHEFLGPNPLSRLGARVRHAGDVDADGVGDYILAAAPDGPSNEGFVWVRSGADGSLLHSFTGAPGAGFGTSVTSLGDVNGDGHDDVAVGAPFDSSNGEAAGKVTVYSGADGSLLHSLSGAEDGQWLGSSIAGVGDLDGDGFMDIAVSVPGDDEAGESAGAVLVISLNRWHEAGEGVAGSGGVVPALQGDGPLEPMTDVVLTLSNAIPDAPVQLVLGYSMFLDPVSNQMVPVPDNVTPSLVTDSTGYLEYTFSWPDGVSQVVVYYQFLVSDPDAPGGVARSNSVRGESP